MSSHCTTPSWKCLRTASFTDLVLKWAGHNFSDFPWRRSRTPYEVLVAELLLKRTTATAAARFYEPFLLKFPSLEDIVSCPLEEVIEALSGIGLQRQRANSIKQLAAWIITECDGEIPNDLPRLLNAPGLGDYSATAILSFGFDVPVAILDANVERILIRVFNESLPLRPSKTKLNEIAQDLLPKEKCKEYNYGLLDLGRLVCRYADPKCRQCPLNVVCDFSMHSQGQGVKEARASYTANPESKLRTFRHYRGLSLKRLAETAGVSKLTVIRIESGKTSPRRATLEKLSKVLGTQPEELID